MGRRARFLVVGLGFAVLAAVGPARLGEAPRLCPWRAAAARDCPGCGLVRGFAELGRGRPRAAAAEHALAVPLAALLLGIAAAPSRRGRSARRRASCRAPGSS